VAKSSTHCRKETKKGNIAIVRESGVGVQNDATTTAAPIPRLENTRRIHIPRNSLRHSRFGYYKTSRVVSSCQTHFFVYNIPVVQSEERRMKMPLRLKHIFRKGERLSRLSIKFAADSSRLLEYSLLQVTNTTRVLF